uniref:Alpha-2-macroglobulin bait region domain-containing protein n=1 Tax=Esox lucius TaxID=8010 RepID=A0AAY5L5X0_ESOLU
TNFVPVNQRVSEHDVHQNRIGQWVNTTTNFKILQLSHPLNSEAAMGSYTITVWIGEQKMHHVFQVAKYVLPRFEVKLNLSDQVNIVQEEYKVEVCATYTYGQPVAGKAELELCRTLGTYYGNAPEGPDYSAPCHKESIETARPDSGTTMFDSVPWVCVAVTEGEVIVKVTVVPEMAPAVQVLVYTVLPSETVIAHSMNFPTEKCFRHKVSVAFSPSKAVPGEKNTLKVSALPGSLCGLSAVDQSVGIMEPGKRLDADKVTACRNIFGVECGFLPRPMMRFESMSLAEPADGHVVLLASPGAPAPLPVQTVRTFFPETWIWDLVESGSADVSLTVPDTITSWDMDTFCLAPGGFGLAPPVTLTVFQPFFLELTLPYSIIRGERFELKATVFSYLSKCIMVSVTPTPSKDYTLTPLEHVQYSSCLCANGRKTFSWTMAPAVLGVLRVSVTAAAVPSNTACNNEVVSVPERGRLDTVTRSLLLVSTSQHLNTLREQVKLELPKNVVAGSARASLSVLGDILGRALKNPDGLLEMPHGCGEQNMAILAPNIYILEYLKNTEQLTPVILDKATKFLASGYQNELNYKHADGAYSTFGQGSGNTWLTAFVLRSFGGARSFVYIDPARIEESRKWLGLQQGQYGCFKILGKLFNNRMKGGVTDEVTLTAYVTAALLEINIPVSDPVVVFSLSCLRNSTRDLSDTYTTALLAYTFSLAGDQKNRDPLLQHLERTALQEGGLLHWSQSFLETSISLSVEVSSYVLLAVLRSSTLSTADLGYASRIVRWLVKQQNANGGFSSTQDTVVGLQALALYSTKVFRKNGAATVTVTSPSGGQHLFDVNPSNKLLYQEKVLQDTGGKYSLKVEGRACASVQVALHYNIPTPSKSTMLSILVRSEVNCDSLSSRRRLHPGHSLNHTVAIIQEHPVQNLKPAVVKIYDYYQPSKLTKPEQNTSLLYINLNCLSNNCFHSGDHAETEYAFPCQ